MTSFRELETATLVELLAEQEANYARLMLQGSKEEFELCKTWIELIQKEMNSRKATEMNTSISDNDINFEAKDENSTD